MQVLSLSLADFEVSEPATALQRRQNASSGRHLRCGRTLLLQALRRSQRARRQAAFRG